MPSVIWMRAWEASESQCQLYLWMEYLEAHLIVHWHNSWQQHRPQGRDKYMLPDTPSQDPRTINIQTVSHWLTPGFDWRSDNRWRRMSIHETLARGSIGTGMIRSRCRRLIHFRWPGKSDRCRTSGGSVASQTQRRSEPSKFEGSSLEYEHRRGALNGADKRYAAAGNYPAKGPGCILWRYFGRIGPGFRSAQTLGSRSGAVDPRICIPGEHWLKIPGGPAMVWAAKALKKTSSTSQNRW